MTLHQLTVFRKLADGYHECVCPEYYDQEGTPSRKECDDTCKAATRIIKRAMVSRTPRIVQATRSQSG